MAKLMSLRQYAAHRGVALRAVQKAIETGRIQTAKDGKIDPTAADLAWERNSDPSKQRKESADGGASSLAYQKARAARETYNARIAQLNYEKMSGRLVDVDMVRLRTFENARAVRDNLLNIPNRISGTLSGLNDPIEIGNLLAKEINQVLEELSGFKDSPKEIDKPEKDTNG